MSSVRRIKELLEEAMTDLVAAGFEHSDMSLLSSHETIEAAEPAGKLSLLPFLSELKYNGPLVSAGLILPWLLDKPLALWQALLLQVVAVREIISEITSVPHTEHFERALEAWD